MGGGKRFTVLAQEMCDGNSGTPTTFTCNLPADLIFEMEEPVNVDSIAIGAMAPDRYPKDWQLLASKDGYRFESILVKRADNPPFGAQAVEGHSDICYLDYHPLCRS